MKCFICEQEIDEDENPYFMEDGESVHYDCYLEFERHWDDKDKFLDFMDKNF